MKLFPLSENGISRQDDAKLKRFYRGKTKDSVTSYCSFAKKNVSQLSV